MRKKMTLDKEIVKYIFPGVHPEIALGEDGYIVYNFDKVYPTRLAVFVSIEVQPSNYSNVFPKSFEEYFRDLDLEISRLSLLIEKGNVFNRFAKTEFVPGQFLKREDEKYIVFRFDELLEPDEKSELLCRTRVKGVSADEIAQIYKISQCTVAPERVSTLGGEWYLYWFLPIECLFRWEDESLLKTIPLIKEALCH